MDRVKTGIPGFDELVEGGLPKGSDLLLVGAPGTGKTIFGLQYLYNGIKNGEKGLYIMLDSGGDEVENQGNQFGWDITTLKKGKKIIFLDVPLNRKMRYDLFKEIEDIIENEGITRVVFDSLSSFIFNMNQFTFNLPAIDDLSGLSEQRKRYLGEDPLFRQILPKEVQEESPDPKYYRMADTHKRIIYLMLRELSKLKTTDIIITSPASSDPNTTVDGVSEFVTDGVVTMYDELIGAKRARTLNILKMRNTKQSPYVHNFEINNNGILIKPAEAVYQ